MRDLKMCLLAILAVSLSACAYMADGTNQFYLAQPQLPVPCGFRGGECGNQTVSAQDPGALGCVAGPVQMMDRRDIADRDKLQLLPGMQLDVSQTTYSRSADAFIPVLSEWAWTVPSSATCGQRQVPGWTRRDIMVVRHLLTGARLPPLAGLPTLNPDYFNTLVQTVAGGCQGAACDEVVQTKLLDPLTQHLAIGYRASESVGEAALGRTPPDGMGAEPKSNQANGLPAGVSETAGLAAWFSGLALPRQADLMGLMNNNQSASGYCAPSQQTAAGNPSNLTASACYFYGKALILNKGWTNTQLVGQRDKSLVSVPIGNMTLTLLNTGDPYFLFRPLAFENTLDTSDRLRCNAPVGSNQECTEENRESQGFIDFSIEIPIRVRGVSTEIFLPADETVARYEQVSGRRVVAIDRSFDWAPARIRVAGKHEPIFLAKLPHHDRHLHLVFVDMAHQDSTDYALKLPSEAKADFVFAPGDRITIKP